MQFHRGDQKGRPRSARPREFLQDTGLETVSLGVPVMAQWLMNPTRNHEVVGSIPDLAQRVKNPVLL